MRVTSSFNLRRRRLVEASIGAAALSLAGVPLPSFAEEQGPVSIRDSRGVHEFRKIPQRVVALQWDILENLVGLGIRPVGAADIAPWSEWVREPALPEGIVNVGTRAEPNLERIAELKPDLILIGPTQEDLLAQLNGIAPVLLFENYRAESVEGEAETAIAQFRELAKLFRAEDRAESEIARIESGLAELGEKVKNAFGTSPQVQVIRFSSLTTLFLYTPNSICDYALKKNGHSAASRASECELRAHAGEDPRPEEPDGRLCHLHPAFRDGKEGSQFDSLVRDALCEKGAGCRS